MLHASKLPPKPGIGFKPQHFADILSGERSDKGSVSSRSMPKTTWARADRRMPCCVQLRERFALSVHGVGLSIGGEAPLDREHLSRLKALCDRYQPESFSEHLAWSSHGELYLNDLLPLPYTQTTLDRIVAHVDQVQTALQAARCCWKIRPPICNSRKARSRKPNSCAEIARRTGCGLLLDVNNVFVQARNHGTSPEAYLDSFPLARVKEIHLGGHDEQSDETGAPLLIDAHGSPVADPVWSLFSRVIDAAGPLPTLIEWDNDVPDFATLADEAAAAGRILARAEKRKAA